jgi:hypothetical protein
MMDPVYWSRAVRADRERQGAKHQFAARVRRLLREPAAPMRRDAIRSLVFDTRPRSGSAAGCCTFGACA